MYSLLLISDGWLSDFYLQVELNKNNMDLTIPHQLFIDNEFVDSSDGKTFKTINPANEEV